MQSELKGPPSKVPGSVAEGQENLYRDTEEIRREIKTVATKLDHFRTLDAPQAQAGGEVMANLTLAFRHMEDASMRLGKVLQHLDGGATVYDRSQVPNA